MARNLDLNSIARAGLQSETATGAANAASSISTTPTNGAIFKRFDVAGGDVLPSVREVESATCWDDPNGILAGSEMLTSATEEAASSSLYYINVYQNQDEADAGVDPHFAIAFGHRLGSGSGDATGGGYTGTQLSLTPSKAIYSQYRNLLLQPSDETFTFGTSGSDSIFVINFNRARYKEKLDPGNWELTLDAANGPYTYIDDSGAATNPDIGASGRVFRIKSGSIANGTASADSTVYGLAYPDVGILVFHPAKLVSAGVIPNSLSDINDTPQAGLAFANGNIAGFLEAMQDGNSFQARTEERVTSTYYFVRVRNNEFNYTNNPTFVTGSAGLVRYGLFQNDPRVYITGVGLYDNNNQLLAVAKLSRPLLKTFTRECLIRVKLTY
jgi:hypothetical protein